MSTALVQKPSTTPAPTVTADELDLIRRTVAKDATPDELKLYLYDCQRQGVHPLDKLLHFTKRGGKYTPVTSIDFMRIRAAETGEMAGSDDPVFTPDLTLERPPVSATVTVYRLTQGQRFAYTATARWSEYKPDQDFMWRKMPHTMLGKCAEACALRKGFPRQLAGLYAKEELDQADSPTGYVVEAPAPPEKREKPSVPNGGDSGELSADLPVGAVLLTRIDTTPTKNANVTKYLITDSTGETYSTIKQQLAALAEQCVQDRTPVFLEAHNSKWGLNLDAIRVALREADAPPPLDDAEIVF